MATITLPTGEAVLIDDEDVPLVSQYKWHLGVKGCAITNARIGGKRTTLLMHRLVMQTPIDMECDHVHHNRLDNRKSELRNCVKAQNQGNRRRNKRGTSQFKGVYFSKAKNKWTAQIGGFPKRLHLGYFSEELGAAMAYDKAAKTRFGEFALINL